MLIYTILNEFIINEEEIDIWNVFGGIMISILAIPLELMMLPVEIVSYIVYRIIKRRRKEGKR